jgi:MFS family permease
MSHSSIGQASHDARLLFVVEFLTSCSTNFLQVGIFFYTQQRFGWTLRSNFLLAAAQGATYVCGAMSAGRLSTRWPARTALARLYVAMCLVGCLGAAFPRSWVLATLLPIYAGLGAMTWPILESLVSTGLESHALSRRIAVYNLVWSGSGAMVIALNGSVIEHFPRGVFAIPAVLHASCITILVLASRRAIPAQIESAEPKDPIAPPDVEPELLRLRTSALWLSRVALPATYVLIYSLMALMPSLPVFHSLDAAHQTLAGSTWMAARLVAFIILGLASWWHTRPRILVLAAAIMLLGFLGVVIRPSDLLGPAAQSADLLSMILWQIPLGLALGMIYAASLYFGMVLSEGSTEHGGYHEALIGLGSILGPGAGALAQIVRPGDVQFGIRAVGSVVAASVLAVAITSLIFNRQAGRTALAP